MDTALLIKTIVIILMLIILFNLGSALVYLVKDQGKTQRTLSALTWRIALSIIVFILLAIGFKTGLIQPHSIL